MAKDPRKEFAAKKIIPRKGYSNIINAVRKREELLKAQANPPPGEIFNKFSGLVNSGVNPMDIEGLVSKEYKIRQAPYAGIAEEREAVESEQAAQAKQQMTAYADYLDEKERKQKVRGKATATQKIWRTDPEFRMSHPTWDEKRIKLETQKRGIPYIKPKKKQAVTASETTGEEPLWKRLIRLATSG